MTNPDLVIKELESLRSENAQLRKALVRGENDENGNEYACVMIMKEEVARLREALEKIADYCQPEAQNDADDLADIARAALASASEKGEGALGIEVVADPTMPQGEAELRTERNRVIIKGMGYDDE